MRPSLLLAAFAMFAIGCAGDGASPTNVNPPAPTISSSLDQSAGSAVQGATVLFNATSVRSASSVGAIAFAVSGLPSGVTASVGTLTTTGLSSTASITLQVGATTTPGAYTVSVAASAAGVSTVERQYALTVTASTGFAQSITPSAISIAASQSGQVTVTLARTTYAGSVALSLVNAPTGVTGTFNLPNVTGNTSTLTLAVDASAAIGTYTLTVRGVATGLSDHTNTLTLTIAPKPAIAVTSSVASISTGQGTTANATITVNRTNFTGAVSFRLSSTLPAGATATFNPTSTTGNTTTLTVTVAANTVVGPFNVIVAAEGTDVTTSSVIIPVTVTGPSLRVTIENSGILVVQNGPSVSTPLTIIRDQVPGLVNITFEGVPAGMTVTASPSSTTGNSSVIAASATTTTPAGNYPIVIRAATPNILAADRAFSRASIATSETVTLTITVQQIAGGNSTATVDFSSCSADQRPVWVATQNGDLSFEYKAVTNHVYSWDVSFGRGTIAYLLQGAGGSTTLMLQSLSLTEWTAPGSRVFCAPPATRTVTGTLSGLLANQVASVSLGGAVATPTTALPGFTLNNVANGTHDLVVYARGTSGASATDRMGFLRDVTNATTNVGTFNIGAGSANAFTVASAPITVSGSIIGNEMYSHGMFYNVGATCSLSSLYFGSASVSNTFTAYGASSLQRASDRHALYVSITNGANASRSVTEYFHDLTARTVTMPTLLLGSAPPVGTGTPYKRYNFATNLVPDLNTSVTMSYSQVGAPKTLTWYASWAWAQGTSMFLYTPDFTGVFGWNNSWLPAAALPTSYSITHTGSNFTTDGCSQANARMATATFTGTN